MYNKLYCCTEMLILVSASAASLESSSQCLLIHIGTLTKREAYIGIIKGLVASCSHSRVEVAVRHVHSDERIILHL